MANKNPPNQWKKGDPSPNPAGRSKMPTDVKELKQLNRAEIEKRMNEFLTYTPQQLQLKKNDPETTMLELFIISILTHGTNKGDQMRLNFLLDRLIGKVKDEVQLQVNPYMGKPLQELEALVKAKLETKKET